MRNLLLINCVKEMVFAGSESSLNLLLSFHLQLQYNFIVIPSYPFYQLQDNFCTLTRIVRLDLSKNSLSSLPENFGELVNLNHVDLLGNNLTRLPLSFAELENLKWLDLKNNPLVVPPQKMVGDCLDDKQCKLCAQRVRFVSVF